MKYASEIKRILSEFIEFEKSERESFDNKYSNQMYNSEFIKNKKNDLENIINQRKIEDVDRLNKLREQFNLRYLKGVKLDGAKINNDDLNMVKNIKLNQDELIDLINKYNDNYTMKKAILQNADIGDELLLKEIANKFNPEIVKNEFENIVRTVIDSINNYKGFNELNYNSRLLLHESVDINEFDNLFSCFDHEKILDVEDPYKEVNKQIEDVTHEFLKNIGEDVFNTDLIKESKASAQRKLKEIEQSYDIKIDEKMNSLNEYSQNAIKYINSEIIE